MRINWVIPCNLVDRLAGGGHLLVGAVNDQIVARRVPTQVVIPVAVNMIGSRAEFEQPHTVHVTVLDPQLAPVSDVDVPLDMQPHPNSPAGWEENGVLALDVVWPVAVHGPHSIEISVDGGAAYSVPINITAP